MVTSVLTADSLKLGVDDFIHYIVCIPLRSAIFARHSEVYKDTAVADTVRGSQRDPSYQPFARMSAIFSHPARFLFVLYGPHRVKRIYGMVSDLESFPLPGPGRR